MTAIGNAQERVPTYCALCISRCGAVATVRNGALLALEPDPSHPTGHALCVKGKAAPELVYHKERLRTPLRRTRPKTDPDPGWQPISWDEALDITATRLLELGREAGPESVVFTTASPSTSAISDSVDWLQRLRRAFGSPNLFGSMELCGWGRFFATTYTFGASVPGVYLPDIENAGCILFWGYNPTVGRLCHATATVAAVQRGARLIVVDPRRAGLANRADEWLRVRPGTDAALALALTHVMIDRGWFDRDFVDRWTNARALVRLDDGRLLRDGGGKCISSAELFGETEQVTSNGAVRCRTVFQMVADECRRYEPRTASEICGVPADQIERTARLLWESRPVGYYAWSGVEQHADATQTARAIAQLHALTGSFDVRGGNVLFPSAPSNPIAGADLLPAAQRAKALGLARRPLGASRWEFVTSDDLYTGILESRPYRVRGIVGFGANLLVAQADGKRGRDALAALDFYVHADLFMNPTAELADIVLPVASPFESEALALGFEVSPAARSLIQLRRPLTAPVGEARSDLQIIFALATRLGLGGHFFDGDIDAAWRHQLAPTGITLEQLRAEPAGIRVPLETRYRKFAEETNGATRGFDTPSRSVELYSETLLDHGYPPLPVFREPALAPGARPDFPGRYPLILTSAKSTWFCGSQHHALASLRRRALEPAVAIHPEVAGDRGIAEGDWVWIESASGSVRARAALDPALERGVVFGQHGWWQAAADLGAPGYDPLGPDSANLNLLIRHDVSDPVSGSIPHRSYRCDVRRCDDQRIDSPPGHQVMV
jgi:anaerobic selenocysteine-containing dehydrogenase